MKPIKPDFTSAAFCENPKLTYDKLRAGGEVIDIRLPLLGRLWMTTSHAATAAMLKDDERFTMRKRSGNHSGDVVGMQWWMPRSIRVFANNMLTTDDPDHKRLRKLVDQAFQRRAVMDMGGAVQEIAERLIDEMVSEASVLSNRQADLVDHYARRLPLLVICELLGLDEERSDRFAAKAMKFSTVDGAFSMMKAMFTVGSIRRMVEEVVDAARNDLAQGIANAGLIAELVSAEQDGDKLNQDELVAMVFLLLFAGHETTTHLISTSVLSLDQNPEQRDQLKADETLFDVAVEELLRFNSPVQFSKPRHVMQAGQFHGQELKQGDKIIACLGCANFDPEKFENPERLDILRKPNPHLEFGSGIHFCLGFQLARLELKVALETLYRRLPHIKVVPDGVQWNRRIGMRALNKLQVEF